MYQEKIKQMNSYISNLNTKYEALKKDNKEVEKYNNEKLNHIIARTDNEESVDIDEY